MDVYVLKDQAVSAILLQRTDKASSYSSYLYLNNKKSKWVSLRYTNMKDGSPVKY